MNLIRFINAYPAEQPHFLRSSLKPVRVHLFQKVLSNGMPTRFSDNCINPAIGTQSGIVLSIFDPLFNLRWGKNLPTIEATTLLIANELFAVVDTEFMSLDVIENLAFLTIVHSSAHSILRNAA